MSAVNADELGEHFDDARRTNRTRDVDGKGLSREERDEHAKSELRQALNTL